MSVSVFELPEAECVCLFRFRESLQQKLIRCRCSSDSESATPATRGILSTRLDVYERDRHEFGAQRIPRVSAGRHLPALESKLTEHVSGVRRSQSRLLKVCWHQIVFHFFVVAKRNCLL